MTQVSSTHFHRFLYIAYTFPTHELFLLFTKSTLNVLHFSSVPQRGNKRHNPTLKTDGCCAVRKGSFKVPVSRLRPTCWRLTFGKESPTDTASTGSGSPGRSASRSVGKDEEKGWRGLPHTEPRNRVGSSASTEPAGEALL